MVHAYPDKSYAGSCRSCGAPLRTLVIDIGRQPFADLLLAEHQLAGPERRLPLRLFVCDVCALVQLPSVDDEGVDAMGIHGHGSAFSSTMLKHLGEWADELIGRLRLGTCATVLDVASGDGTLLRPFQQHGMRVVGLEPNAAIAARAKVATRHCSFGYEAAKRLVATEGQFDLVLVNHALAHAVDVDDFVAGLATALRPSGTVAIEFHHALSLVRGQFEVACHAHRSYLSLCALKYVLARHGLVVVDAQQIEVHGGSIKALGAHRVDRRPKQSGVRELEAKELAWGLDRADGYVGVAPAAERIRRGLVDFLQKARADGTGVVAYGAPSRGITLLNYCSVTPEDIAFTVDRSPDKQRRFLPGSRLPVLAPKAIEEARPGFVVILPWALSNEIIEQMAAIRTWGGRFVVAVPELRTLD